MRSQAPVVEQRCEASARRDQQPQPGQELSQRLPHVVLDHRGFGRAAVGLAVLSAGVHIVLAAEAWSRSMTTAGFLVGMAAVCLTCAPALWRGGSLHAWMTMLGLAGAMLFAHWQLCFACGPAVHHSSAGRPWLANAALLLMAAEIVVATTAVVRLLLHPNPDNREVVPS